MEVVLVGTSDAFGAGGRRQSAYLLRAPGGSVLVDCGQTTLTGLSALGVSRDEIDGILLSHFHADHFGGIPLLLLAALYQDRRRRPLRIAGPVGVEQRIRAAARALGHPIEDLELGFPLLFQELHAGRELEVGPVRAGAFPTHHSPDSCPHGLRIRAGGRCIAYSGDTGWFDDLPSQVNGSDLFLCECTFLDRSFEYHLSLEEMRVRAGDFDCGRLLLTHLGAEMRSLADSGGFDLADDGDVLKL